MLLALTMQGCDVNGRIPMIPVPGFSRQTAHVALQRNDVSGCFLRWFVPDRRANLRFHLKQHAFVLRLFFGRGNDDLLMMFVRFHIFPLLVRRYHKWVFRARFSQIVNVSFEISTVVEVHLIREVCSALHHHTKKPLGLLARGNCNI